MDEHSLIYMTNLYNEAMDLNTKLLEELENLKGINEEHRHLNGKLREENNRLNNIINKTIKYCEESNMTLKSHYFMDVIKILKGGDKE